MLVPNGEPWNSYPTEFLSFEENQRSYIASVLQRTDGKVSGQDGLAGTRVQCVMPKIFTILST